MRMSSKSWGMVGGGLLTLALMMVASQEAAAQSTEVASVDRWAVVNDNGTVARSKGVTSVQHSVTGQYIVRFNKNVRSCVYVATIGLGGAAGVESPGEITVVGASVAQQGVFVTTHNSSGFFADRGFHLYVGC